MHRVRNARILLGERTQVSEQWQRIIATAMECPLIDGEFLADERKS
jgi:hypothetical protein